MTNDTRRVLYLSERGRPVGHPLKRKNRVTITYVIVLHAYQPLGFHPVAVGFYNQPALTGRLASFM